MSRVIDLSARQISSETHSLSAGGDILHNNHLDPGHNEGDTQARGAGVNHLADDRRDRDAHAGHVVGNHFPESILAASSNKSATPEHSYPQTSNGANPILASSADPSPETNEAAEPSSATSPGSPHEFALAIAAETLTDLERTRIALENRLRAMQQFHGTDDTAQYRAMKVIMDGIATMEHQSKLHLQRTLRKHPLGPWVANTIGIGEKQGARLIAAIGDVYMKDAQYDQDTGEVIEEARPRRGPAELWAYCGYAPEQKRRKGVKSNWNAQAKMRAFLIAESCMKQKASPYRPDYDAARASWADRDTSDGHKHNHALRVTAKAILRDMFLEAKRIANT